MLWQPDDDLTPAELAALTTANLEDAAAGPDHLGALSCDFSPTAPHAPPRSETGGPLEGGHARGSAVPACIAAIVELLPDGTSMASRELSTRLAALGFKPATIRRAREATKLKPSKGLTEDAGWFVQLPTPPVEDAQAAVDDESPWSDVQAGGGDGGPPDRKSTNPTVSDHDPDPVASATARLELARKAQAQAEIELGKLRSRQPEVEFAALIAEPGAVLLRNDLEHSITDGALQLERLTLAVEHAERLVQAAIADVDERDRAAREARDTAAYARRDVLYVAIEDLVIGQLAPLVREVLELRSAMSDRDERNIVAPRTFNFISRWLHLAGLTEMRLFSGLGESLAPAKKGDPS